MERVSDEGMGERVDEDHCEGAFPLAHVSEVLQEDCDSSAELRITVHERVVFLEVITDFLQQAFYSRKDSSKRSKAKFKLNLGKIDRTRFALHS